MSLLRNTIDGIRGVDEDIMNKVQSQLDDLTKPQGSLGRLEFFAKRVAGIVRSARPMINRKVIFTMAADHGVAEEGVSLFPQEVTRQMVLNFINGGAGINILAKHIGAEIIVVDMGVKGDFNLDKDIIANFRNRKIGYGTANITKGPAMKRGMAIKAIESGIMVFNEEFCKKRIDIVGVGDMGIANTTPSSAIISLITGSPPEAVTGKGTGIDNERLKNKIDIVKKALWINRPNPDDPIDVLSKVGGYEIAGICGVILASAERSTPVVIDGFISTASALIAYKLQPAVKDFIFAAHQSEEKGHKIVLSYMGLEPILNLKMRLGEGTGSALAISIIEAGVKILNEMASFKKAGVSRSIE